MRSKSFYVKHRILPSIKKGYTMKIGIITFHASLNCGSMLQAYALQTVLEKKYGADVEIINFANSGSRNMYNVIDLRPKKSAIRNNIKSVTNLGTIIPYRRDYLTFKKQYLHLSAGDYRTAKQLEGIEKKYDLLIAGGDQIWNVRCPDADKAYFLGFAKDIKKVAYSPSLGANDISESAKDPEEYKRYLLDFDYLSVREPNGKKWLEKLTGREVEIVADPTLLLTKEEWVSGFDLPQTEEHYIFNYAFFHNREETNLAIQKISEQMNMPVYVLDGKSWAYYKLDKYGIKKFPMTGPLAFLALMKNADLVLTQSFHGTIFSVLFEKQFWSYKRPVENEDKDDRAVAILKQLGLSERYQVIDELPNMDYLKKIDYENGVSRKAISELKENAFAYLDKVLGERA